MQKLHALVRQVCRECEFKIAHLNSESDTTLHRAIYNSRRTHTLLS
jgi:hypothetical protein